MKSFTNDGKVFNVTGDNLQVKAGLPANTYTVTFDPRQGYSLVKIPDMEVGEKIYGNHTDLCDTVFETFLDEENWKTSVGVILSGEKGTGKSICAKLLMEKALKNDVPVIVVNHATPGLAEFITDIACKCIVVFDEFDKTFRNLDDGSGGEQAGLLTMLDGTLDNRNKMFVLTCNDLGRVSKFIVNRCSRALFHLMFDHPDIPAIREYLGDKMSDYVGTFGAEWVAEQIEKVVEFRERTNLTYDNLHAIAYFMQKGKDFDDVLKFINILNVEPSRYRKILMFKDGTEWKCNNATPLSLGLDRERCDNFAPPTGTKYEPININFNDIDIAWSTEICAYFIKGSELAIEYLEWLYDNDYEEGTDQYSMRKAEIAETLEELKTKEVLGLRFEKVVERTTNAMRFY